MAILGYNTKDTASGASVPAGRLMLTKFALASAQALGELHAWMKGSAGLTCRLAIYADTGGVPGARIAYTTVKTLSGSDIEIAETGFSNALAAGDYWIGAYSVTDDGSTFVYGNGSGATSAYADSVANPPPATAPTMSTFTRKLSAWAVVGAAAPPPRPIRINTTAGWAEIGNTSSFVSGTGAPTASVGANGAIYLDTVSGYLYGPKAAGVWPSTPIPRPP